LNCAAVPAELIESELFGHEKGSFTGAAARHIGRFEQAQHGTLFLDEIGDMPLVMQAKLLRVLEESQVERVGGGRPIPVDVRVLVATHRNLDDLVKKGAFRQDLYHRVYVYPLVLPPLRERTADIPALIAHFAAQIASQNGWRPKTFEPEAIEALRRYSWPGNVRELRNVVERLLLLAEGPVDAGAVRLALPSVATIANGAERPRLDGTLAQRVETFEREVILAELKHHSQRMTDTAKALGLERSHLYKKCQALGIDLRAMRRGGDAGNA
jgi:DNA-binding NtrC family response regulator